MIEINRESDKPMRFSIVVPSFNQAPFIRKTLDSIKGQSYKDYEVIVIDGGSTDETVSIINEEYADVVNILISEPDLGQSDALNKGFALATGDIMGWMNSDDIYAEGAFANTVQAFQRDSHILVVFGDWMEISETGSALRREFAFDFSKLQTVYEGAQMNCQAMFWKSEVHHMFSGFDLKLQTSMDYQFLLEISLKLPAACFKRLPNILGCFRRYEGQKTDGSQYSVYLDEHRYIAQKYNVMQKLNFIGYLIKIILKARRLKWYLKRGGSFYVLKRLRSANFIFRKEFL